MELTKNTKLRRIQWVGHVMKMREERVLKKTLKGRVKRGSPVARSRERWLDAVGRDGKRF
jgi:hypothetical protein